MIKTCIRIQSFLCYKRYILLRHLFTRISARIGLFSKQILIRYYIYKLDEIIQTQLNKKNIQLKIIFNTEYLNSRIAHLKYAGR